jgi:hypothetical protein
MPQSCMLERNVSSRLGEPGGGVLLGKPVGLADEGPYSERESSGCALELVAEGEPPVGPREYQVIGVLVLIGKL